MSLLSTEKSPDCDEELSGAWLPFPVCPLCACRFKKKDNSLVCENGHCYDIAKSGYVNLLPASAKKHGDGADMLAARRDFLEKGYYSDLRNALCSLLKSGLEERTALSVGSFVLDCGCGEGYYTEAIAGALPEAHVCGIDVSSKAAAMAARRKGLFSVAAASSNRIPCTDGFFSAIITIFAPFSFAEFTRAIRPGGYFINVIPDEYHLWEMKELLYEHPYVNTINDYAIEGFEFLHEVRTSSLMDLENRCDIAALFGMTPYCKRTPPEAVRRLLSSDSLRVRAQFRILVYKKLPSQ